MNPQNSKSLLISLKPYLYPIISLNKTYLVIFLLALSQGIVGLSDLALNYLYKDDLALLPPEVTQINSIIIIPSLLKPIYGIISDTFPLFGFRRKPYLFIFGIISTICWLMLGLSVSSKGELIFWLFTKEIACAFCGVVGDALIVEISRAQSAHDKEAAAKNVSMFFIIKSTGSLITALASGVLLEIISKRTVFIITSTFPLLIVLSSLVLTEEECNNNNTISKIKESKRKEMKTQIKIFLSFLSKEQIYKPVIFILLFMASPSYSDPLFYFYTNILRFSPSLMGRLKLIYGVSSLLGIWLYNAYLKSVGFKKIMWYTSLLSMLFNLLALCVVERINLLLGISDFVFCVAADSLANSLGEINMMPILVIACNICPKSIEGTIYAFLISMINFGLLLSNKLGSDLAFYLGITDTNFVNLSLLIIISNMTYLVPMPLLFLIKETSYNSFEDYSESANVEEKLHLLKE